MLSKCEYNNTKRVIRSKPVLFSLPGSIIRDLKTKTDKIHCINTKVFQANSYTQDMESFKYYEYF